MLALKLAMRLVLLLGFLQCGELGFGEDEALLGHFGFQRFKPFIHGLEIMAEPHAAHAGRGDRKSTFPQLVGNADLPEGRLLDGKRDDGVLDLLGHAVLEHWLLAANLG
jgi:hypothetical protein